MPNQAAGALKETLILRVSATELKQKKDTFCVIWLIKAKSGMRQQVGKTEIIEDSVEPEFVKGIVVDYHFEENQQFMLEMYDAVDKEHPNNLKKQDFIIMI